MRGAKEVLVITGRGNQSVGGVAVVRAAVEKLLFSLRRQGVVDAHREHNPGAFVVDLAGLRALADAPPRNRERAKPLPDADIRGLSEETLRLLRELAERSIEALGITPDERQLAAEMQRYLGTLVAALPTSGDLERDLRVALQAAIAEFD